MTKTLLHKYKPNYLDDFEDNENITDVLKTFISLDIIRILFISKQSNGKTSYINAIINEYYKDVENYTDNVLCINSVKDYGMSFYKNELVHFCKTPSFICKKKMIVLDDFDFISEQNQHIFKNIIENFPNIHFLLSGSTPQKIITSIQSMLHIIEIKKITPEKMMNIFNKIKTNEGIDIDENVEKNIIEKSNINQMINTLEKCLLLKMKITEDVAANFSTIKNSLFITYLKEVENQNLSKGIEIFYGLYYEGYSVFDILYHFYEFIKNNDIEESVYYNIIPFICKYTNIFHNHEDIIELALFTNNLLKCYITNN
jgi:DNA polymerase III delta prime subunit